MSAIAAIGEPALVSGFAFAGVEVVAVQHPDEVVTAWRALSQDVGVVILSQMAVSALGDGELKDHKERLCVVIPQ